jgi:hypothetical protein
VRASARSRDQATRATGDIMTRLSIVRRAAFMAGRHPGTRRVANVGLLAGLAILLAAAAAAPANAQFGALKRLKELKDAVSGPDSAARVKDSLAKISVANGEVVAPDSAKAGQSLFSRATSAAGKASDKFEKVTGVSAKDAALAATGAGVAGLAAKKLGVDPMSLAGNAVGKMNASAQKKAMQAQGAVPGMPGGSAMQALQGAPSGQAMQAMQGMQAMQLQAQAQALKSMTAPNVGNAALLAGAPDAQIMLAFQQEMMQAAMAATSGDAAARARLDAWTVLTNRFELQAAPLMTAAGNGDVAAMSKLQGMQTALMREWMNAGAPRAKASKP